MLDCCLAKLIELNDSFAVPCDDEKQFAFDHLHQASIIVAALGGQHMRLCAIDYQLRSPDSRICSQAKGLGVAAIELTRSTLLPESRWLGQPDGASRWFSSALAMSIALESISASFAYEWSPIDRKGRVDETIIDALAHLVETASFVGARGVHAPCLEAPPPKNPADLRRIVNFLAPVLEKAQERSIALYLETYWPADLARSVADLDPDFLKISFDVGNCIAVGRDAITELETLGSSLGQIRLRDRRRLEIFRSLPMGHGDVPWSAVQQQVLKLSDRPQVVLASTGGASLVESYASAHRLLYNLLSEPAFSRVA